MATKRTHNSDSEEEEIVVTKIEKKPKTEFTGNKHTLDSDEEDSQDDEKYELNPDDIEGAEDGITRMEGDIQVTPFNMDEELEIGHFDEDGHYQWHKKDDEVKDNWLDNVEFMPNSKMKKTETSEAGGEASTSSSTSSGFIPPEEPNEIERLSVTEIYQKIIDLMKPKETVKRLFSRLSGHDKKLTTIERYRLKKAGKLGTASEDMNKLTEYVNEITARTNDLDIYDHSYEELVSKISTELPSKTPDLSTATAPSKSPTTDMFGDEFQEESTEDAGNSDLSGNFKKSPP